jgi:hypothetical protein
LTIETTIGIGVARGYELPLACAQFGMTITPKMSSRRKRFILLSPLATASQLQWAEICRHAVLNWKLNADPRVLTDAIGMRPSNVSPSGSAPPSMRLYPGIAAAEVAWDRN